MRAHFGSISAVLFTVLLVGSSSGQRLRPLQAQADPSPAAVQENVAVPSITVLASKQAEGVLGKEVRSSAGENMGRIVDVIVDKAGRVRAAVIDFGGFLGVGSRKIAVDWNALHFAPDSSKREITLELTRDQVKAAPEYKEKHSVVVLGGAGGLQSMPDW